MQWIHFLDKTLCPITNPIHCLSKTSHALFSFNVPPIHLPRRLISSLLTPTSMISKSWPLPCFGSLIFLLPVHTYLTPWICLFSLYFMVASRCSSLLSISQVRISCVVCLASLLRPKAVQSIIYHTLQGPAHSDCVNQAELMKRGAALCRGIENMNTSGLRRCRDISVHDSVRSRFYRFRDVWEGIS